MPSLHGMDAGTKHSARPNPVGQAHTQNAYIESVNGKFWDEYTNENWFESLTQARKVIAIWRQDYNDIRLH